VKILIAEDDQSTQMFVNTMLTKQKHESIIASDGEAAWEILERQYIPLVITDLLMPKVNGLELCSRIRSRSSERYTYIIVLTALGDKDSFLQAMTAGANDFVTKPFDPDEFVARVRVAEYTLELHEAVHRLEQLLPVCTQCKRIRDKAGQWVSLKTYTDKLSDADAPCLCPDCATA